MIRRPLALICLVSALMWPRAACADPLPSLVGQDQIHTVEADEDLPDIAHHYSLALEHISFANGLPLDKYVPDTPVGETLVIPLRRILPLNPPSDGMVLNIPERGIYLFHHGQFVKFYPVAVGRPDFKTPRGSFYIIQKTKDPTWVPPSWAKVSKKVYPPGEDNPLGDRWMGLSVHGVGIHGTTSPAAIGMDVSHGCIRLYPDLCRELYERVSVGTPVRIEYEPVKLGFDRASNTAYLAVYPDIYSLVDPTKRALELVRESGLKIPAHRVLEVVHQGSGRVTSLSVDPIVVEVNQHQVPLLSPPIRQNGALWVPLPVLTAAGLKTESDDTSVTVTKAEHPIRVRLQDGSLPSVGPIVETLPDGTQQTVGYHWHGQIMVPATSVFHALGIPYQWQAQSATLSIRTDP